MKPYNKTHLLLSSSSLLSIGLDLWCDRGLSVLHDVIGILDILPTAIDHIKLMVGSALIKCVIIILVISLSGGINGGFKNNSSKNYE